MEEALKDERFSHILLDPRFRRMPKHVQKVTLDKRMKMIFKDSSFKAKCELDKRGRKLNLTPSENLKRLYDMTSESSEDDDDDEEEEEEDNIDKNSEVNEMKKRPDSEIKNLKNNVNNTVSSKSLTVKGKDNNEIIPSVSYPEESTSEESDGDDNEDSGDSVKDEVNKAEIIKEKKKTKFLEDDSDSSSSEESDDTDSSDDSSENESGNLDHGWEELRDEAPDTTEITRRLAVCNMDWDRIRAVDLLVCFNSFKPPDGSINCVKIYPSEYGLKRMEEERLKGPPELVEKKLAPDEEEAEDREGSKHTREKLRQYQISRLKYYYAVVDCDSPETANVLYEHLNGMEYESSAVRFDLRFIPDDVTFDQEPTSSADKPPDPTEYTPRLFVTTALQQVKVDLTWDETDIKRKEFFQKVFVDPDSVQTDIQDYLASASSESEVEEGTVEEGPSESMKTKDRIAKYKELLLSLEEKEKNEENEYDIEVTWEMSAKERVEEQVREKIKKDTLNPFEEMIQKKKEDRKMKKKQQKTQNKAEESLSDDSDEEEFFEKDSMSSEKKVDEKKLAELALITDSKKESDNEGKSRKKSKKDKSKDLDDFVGDANDPRFAAMYSSSLFNMVPSNNKSESKSEKRRKFKPSHYRLSNKRTKH